MEQKILITSNKLVGLFILKIIETERLYLRKLVMEDKNELSKVLTDFEFMQYYPHTFNEDEVENWIQWNIVLKIEVS